MKSILLFVILLSVNCITFAGGGWATSAVSLTKDGGSSYLFRLNDEGWTDGSWGSNTDFSSYDFGTPSSLILNGGAGNGWTDDDPGYTTSSFKIYYRVYLSTDAGGAWNVIDLDNLSYHSGNNKIYDKGNASIDLLGLVESNPGEYTIEVVMSKNQYYLGGNWNSMVPGGQGTAYNSSSAGYKATFEIAPLPVELSLFTAIINKNQVTLNWQTTTEVNNYGFEIEKSINNGSWDKIGFVKGAGNSYSKKEYTFSDNLELNLNIRYRLKQIDNDGQFSYSNEIALNEVKTPESFVLSQNYPNPFNPSTVISYQLPVDSKVKLDLFTVNGEKIATLFEGTQSSGTYNYSLSSESVIGYQLTSGVYLYRLQANDFTQTKKLMLMK